MDYTAEASGAAVYNILSVFVNWGYSNTMTYNYVPGGNFRYSDVESDISLNHPVIFDGYHTKTTTTYSPWWYFGFTETTNSYSDGHAWVCDGMEIMTHRCYNDLRSYSMNWGWGGNSNGFYGAPTPRLQTYNFQYNMHTLRGIHP